MLDCVGVCVWLVPPVQVECCTWRPCGTEKQELYAHLVGGRPQLKTTSVIATDIAQRFHLSTVGSGTVTIQLHVIVKNMDKIRMEW